MLGSRSTAARSWTIVAGMRALASLLAVFVLGSAAAGCQTVVVTCDLDADVAADLVKSSDVLDCAAALDSPDAGSDVAAWTAAQRCVLDAVAAGRAFKLVYTVPDPVLDLRVGYTGVPAAGGKLVVRAYGFSGLPMVTGDLNPTLSATSCTGSPPLTDTNANPKTPCTPDVGRVCLTCNTTVPGTLLCGFQP